MITNLLSARLHAARRVRRLLRRRRLRLPAVHLEWRYRVELLLFVLLALVAAIPIVQAAEAIRSLHF
jgi:hypothetical protein